MRPLYPPPGVTRRDRRSRRWRRVTPALTLLGALLAALEVGYLLGGVG